LSIGTIDIPDVELAGRQSKIIVTDYKLGESTLLFSSADVLTYATLDADVLALYLNIGQTGSFALVDASSLNFTVYGGSNVTASQTSHGTVYTYTQPEGISVIQFSNGLIVYLLDKATAWNFFAPPQTLDPIVKPDQHIFVIGPYLVRGASFKGNTIEIVGDNENTTSIEYVHGSFWAILFYFILSVYS
jgi:beta-galactosidase